MLAEGFAANPSAFAALEQRLSFRTADTAAACLVHPRTVRLWRASSRPNPTAVRLLAILAGFMPWVGWDDWEIHRGYLFPPGYRRAGILPGEFFALIYYRQTVSEQRRMLVERDQRIAELEARLAMIDQPAAAA